MYCEFFGLKEKPFRNTLDPVFYYSSSQHRQVLHRIVEGLRERCGLVLLVGEAGTGKTLLCSRVHENQVFVSAYIDTPFLTEREFLEKLNTELGIPPGDRSRKALIDALRGHLLREYQRGSPVALFVDEAHRLRLPLLELIQALSNLQTSRNPLLQIVLIGESGVLDKLSHPRLKSLNRRTGLRCRLDGMDRSETAAYIRHRLQRAGGANRHFFTRGAFRTIWRTSRGTAGLVNHLCDLALREACRRGKERVGAREVKKVFQASVYRPLFGRGPRPLKRRFAGACLALLFFAGIFLTVRHFETAGRFVLKAVKEKQPIHTLQVVPTESVLGESSDWIGNDKVGRIIFVKNPIVRSPSTERGTNNSGLPVFEPLMSEYGAKIRSSGKPGPEADVDLSGVKLNAIAWEEDESRRIAVLNEKVLHEGDFFGPARLVRIHPDYVVLLCKNEYVLKRIHEKVEGL